MIQVIVSINWLIRRHGKFVSDSFFLNEKKDWPDQTTNQPPNLQNVIIIILIITVINYINIYIRCKTIIF